MYVPEAERQLEAFGRIWHTVDCLSPDKSDKFVYEMPFIDTILNIIGGTTYGQYINEQKHLS